MKSRAERTLVGNLSEKVGETVLIEGWISVRRDQGKLIFFDFRDRTGVVQGVVPPSSAAFEAAKTVSLESAVSVEGIVEKRPEKNIVEARQNGSVELKITTLEVLNQAQVLPFDLDAEVHLDTLLDYRPLLLKKERSRDIFRVQATLVEEYRRALQKRGFVEFQAPALVGGDAEGGAAAFKVNYYYDTTAFLATSPQFYKEIFVNAFERSFTVAKIFRGEKHATPRHLSELTQMDFEMGFIEDFHDVTRVLEEIIREVVEKAEVAHGEVFERFDTDVPLAPDPFPMLTLQEAHEIIRKEYGRDIEDEGDMSPEDERQICEWARKERASDFVFITHYPTARRAFYTYENSAEAPLSSGFDLLFRGLEINSGSQRIHNYEEMIARMRLRGLDPEKFSFYLQAHKYGIPPHGGSSTGLERLTARMLGLPNIREASAFPRDLNRIDVRMSE